jgi:hypothetical protein
MAASDCGDHHSILFQLCNAGTICKSNFCLVFAKPAVIDTTGFSVTMAEAPATADLCDAHVGDIASYSSSVVDQGIALLPDVFR